MKILFVVELFEVLVWMVLILVDCMCVFVVLKKIVVVCEMCVSLVVGIVFVCLFGEFLLIVEYGFVDVLGCWDYWLSGFVLIYLNDCIVCGMIVIDCGDILLL